MYEKHYPQEGIIVFSQKREPNGYEHIAQLILEEAIFQFQKEKLMKKIDDALADGDKARFLQLSAQYKNLLKEYGYLRNHKIGESA